jgi:hypothetical protein
MFTALTNGGRCRWRGFHWRLSESLQRHPNGVIWSLGISKRAPTL